MTDTPAESNIDEEQYQLGMDFIRAFGVDIDYIDLKADNISLSDVSDVSLDTISTSDVNWSDGYIVNPDNTAVLSLNGKLPENIPVEPVGYVQPEDVYLLEGSMPDSCAYVNSQGSAKMAPTDKVRCIEDVFGYGYNEISNIRIPPGDKQASIKFESRDSNSFVLIAPRVGGVES